MFEPAFVSNPCLDLRRPQNLDLGQISQTKAQFTNLCVP
jgi:hypothetical protein